MDHIYIISLKAQIIIETNQLEISGRTVFRKVKHIDQYLNPFRQQLFTNSAESEFVGHRDFDFLTIDFARKLFKL